MGEHFGYQVEVTAGYDEAVVRTRLALKAEGFSIITEMHVGGLLGPEAGDERQYLILGAWAPPAGSPSRQPGLELTTHVPCNFVVQETGSSALVATLDPMDGVVADEDDDLGAVDSAQTALGRVLQRIGASG